MQTREIVSIVARGFGVIAAGAAAVLWAAAMWMPSAQSVLRDWSFAVAALMLFISILAVLASLRGHGNIMLGMFLASFLPVGAYLIRVDHWLQWVGILNVVLLVAALLTRWAMARDAGSP